VAVTN
jgi:hypothetical protein